MRTDKFRAANRTDDEFRARFERRTAGVGVQNGPNTDKSPRTYLLAGLANRSDRPRRRHRDFGGVDAARDERLAERQELISALRTDDGDDSGVRQQRNDFGFGPLHCKMV